MSLPFSSSEHRPAVPEEAANPLNERSKSSEHTDRLTFYEKPQKAEKNEENIS